MRRPVRLADKLPPRGTDIMVLGYPLGPSFGTTLKSTRGAMVAMPDPSLENMFLYDAITNPGNSGGPLCDKCGRVAGVVRAVTGSVGGTYGAGISITDAMPFIRKHVPELAAAGDRRKRGRLAGGRRDGRSLDRAHHDQGRAADGRGRRRVQEEVRFRGLGRSCF